MIESTLFETLTTHCFYGCGHVEKDLTTDGSSDAMERHYWDSHYTSKDRKEVRAAGQTPDRVGVRQGDHASK